MAKLRGKAMAVRRRGRLWRLTVATAVFLLCLLGWGGWRGLHALLSSDWLTLRYLEIEGCRVLPVEYVQEKLQPLLGRPIHTVDPDSIVRELSQLPRVTRVKIQRRLPGTLRCRITESEPLALLFDGEFKELDASGRKLQRFGDPPPDLPIIRTGAEIPPDSLVGLALRALEELRDRGFDLSAEVSELAAGPDGIIYFRNASDTRVILGWEDFGERIETYAQVSDKVAGQGFPRELDLRFKDQVVAR